MKLLILFICFMKSHKFKLKLIEKRILKNELRLIKPRCLKAVKFILFFTFNLHTQIIKNLPTGTFYLGNISMYGAFYQEKCRILLSSFFRIPLTPVWTKKCNFMAQKLNYNFIYIHFEWFCDFFRSRVFHVSCVESLRAQIIPNLIGKMPPVRLLLSYDIMITEK